MNPPIVYEVTKPTAQRTSKITAMVQSTFLTSLRGPAISIHKDAASAILPRRTVPGPLRELFLPGLTHVDDDVDGVRRIQREESLCQPQQVVVVVRSFRFSPLQDNTNGIFDHPAVIHPIDRDRSHLVFLVLQLVGGRIPRIIYTVILPASLRYRLLSETRAAVCLIPGPVFVLWQEGTQEDSDQSIRGRYWSIPMPSGTCAPLATTSGR